MGGCGCKKKTNTQPVQTNVTVVETKQNEAPKLTPEQQQQVDRIMETLNKLNK